MSDEYQPELLYHVIAFSKLLKDKGIITQEESESAFIQAEKWMADAKESYEEFKRTPREERMKSYRHLRVVEDQEDS